MPEISIIMPVFNTPEPFLKDAVQSVLDQDYFNYELLIVDDGSEPKTAAVCDSLAAEKDCIHVFHQENQGASSARNNGTAKAQGNYIMYMDSDDLLDKHMLSECADLIHRLDADFIFGGIKRISSKDGFVYDNPSEMDYRMFSDGEIEELRASLLGRTNPDFKNVKGGGIVNRGPYARAVKREIANKVLFNSDLRIGEDVVWNLEILKHVHSACFVNRIWYGYAFRNDSAINKYYGNRHAISGKYIETLYANDPEFCEKHVREYLSDMAAAFHSCLRRDFMSEKCPLTEKEKRAKVKDLLKTDPWNRMLKDKKLLSVKHRILTECCRLGCIFTVMKIYDR